LPVSEKKNNTQNCTQLSQTPDTPKHSRRRKNIHTTKQQNT